MKHHLSICMFTPVFLSEGCSIADPICYIFLVSRALADHYYPLAPYTPACGCSLPDFERPQLNHPCFCFWGSTRELEDACCASASRFPGQIHGRHGQGD
eukprot:1136789-Pelagomonas_calceolata.AAC.2